MLENEYNEDNALTHVITSSIVQSIQPANTLQSKIQNETILQLPLHQNFLILKSWKWLDLNLEPLGGLRVDQTVAINHHRYLSVKED